MFRCINKPLPVWLASLLVGSTAFFTAQSLEAGDPPTINPFGTRPTEREDALPGYIETSDGKVEVGRMYLTRDTRLKMFDESLQRQREIPLRVVKQIECHVKKEWMEKEWRFKELALDEKYYTGRSYPAREYKHTITLQDGRKITGPLSGIVYLKPGATKPPEPGEYRPHVKALRFLLHKREKGEIGGDLKSLTYTKLIKLGEDAVAEGKRKAARYRPKRRT